MTTKKIIAAIALAYCSFTHFLRRPLLKSQTYIYTLYKILPFMVNFPTLREYF